jgi:DNA-binding transcriptional MerR regulator
MELTIGELARATGLRTGTLRMWETRYGFPAPARSSGQQRRYARSTVELIAQIRADRARGLALPAAIERARAGGRREKSLFGLIRRLEPRLPVYRLRKSALVVMSRAIEDECASRGDQTVLIGAFQQERHYRAAQRRWEELARPAPTAMVLADFPGAAGVDRHPREIPLGMDQPLAREWAIIAAGPQLAVGLIGWEIPLARPADRDAHRLFETTWCADRELIGRLISAAGAVAVQAVPAIGAGPLSDPTGSRRLRRRKP